MSGDADAAARFLASLKLHLPNIFLAAKVRGEVLVENAGAVVELGAKLDPGSLSVKAAACLIPAANAIGEAAVNAKAGFEASVSVAGAVGG